NGATTYPKPESVYREVNRCMTDYCGNPGRGGHSMSLAAGKAVYDCRCLVAELFSCEPENVVFTLNTTYALNMAIKGIARTGDHIIISNMEHNSVLRPVITTGCDYDVFDAMGSTEWVIRDILSKLTPRTRMIVCTHKSNVCPVRLPIRAIGELCRQRGLCFIVDAAQSAGVYPIDVRECHIDALCFAGHKSLYGIQGAGGVIFSSRYKGESARKLHTLVEGGSGIASLEEYMPALLPERLEAGTLPTPAIAGLSQGIRAITEVGINHIREHEISLYRRTRERLSNHDRIEVYCPEIGYGETILFNIENMSSTMVADKLDREGICVRAGFHCAPLAHKHLGTGDSGAVRVSFGAFNTAEEVDIFCDVLNRIIKEDD
ncbi:MAG: aminotransferase class V-fold PLP-dependent enzyme, partial [Clostridia bacterium]|nr:aminotransferase class V-fold PLP-dependent enzyme [Clostridia bacterium]